MDCSDKSFGFQIMPTLQVKKEGLEEQWFPMGTFSKNITFDIFSFAKVI